MKDIDFLPAGFRQQHSGHNVRLWRFVVVVGFLAMLTAASLVQCFRLYYARGQLAQLTAQHDAAKKQFEQLDELQSELNKATSDAELFTYLRHPWPRTQVLAALLAPLPDSVTLNQLEIKAESPSRSRHAKRRQRRESDKNNEPAESLLPAQGDLAMLREQLDSVRVVAILSGRTTDPAALHQYLSQLSHGSLVAKAELDSLESITTADKEVPEGAMSFRAIVTLRPSYAQPGGPTGSMHMVQRAAGRKNHALPNPSRDREGAVPRVIDKLDTAIARPAMLPTTDPAGGRSS